MQVLNKNVDIGQIFKFVVATAIDGLGLTATGKVIGILSLDEAIKHSDVVSTYYGKSVTDNIDLTTERYILVETLDSDKYIIPVFDVLDLDELPIIPVTFTLHNSGYEEIKDIETLLKDMNVEFVVSRV